MAHEHEYDMPAEHEHAENGEYSIPPPPPATHAVTAFLIVCHPDGTKVAFSDVNLPLELEREATLNDMYDGCGQVRRDIEIMQVTGQVVNNTINGMMMAMAQQMEAAKNAKIAEKLASKGIHVPR